MKYEREPQAGPDAPALGERLPGGHSSEVRRIGDTVRRSAGAWTPRVQGLLAHLRRRGLDCVPEPLGLDAEGREVLGYIPGLVGHAPLPEPLRHDGVLADAARLLRRLHDATADIASAWPDGWQAPRREPVEVICHGDYAPYNLVHDGRTFHGVIDFDHAHPGPRAWDIAYAVYRIAPLAADTNPDTFGSLADQCRRLRRFCDAYGLADRCGLVECIVQRIGAMATHLLDGEAAGDARRIARIATGDLAIYRADQAHVERHRARFEATLA